MKKDIKETKELSNNDVINKEDKNIDFEEDVDIKLQEVLKEKKFREVNNLPKLLFKGGYFLFNSLFKLAKNEDLVEIGDDKGSTDKNNTNVTK